MTTLETVLAGTTVTLRATLRDADGVLANPSTVTFRVQDPAGVVVAYTAGQLTNPSTGVFERDVGLAAAGTYLVQVVTTGDPTVVAEAAVDVRATAVP